MTTEQTEQAKAHELYDFIRASLDGMTISVTIGEAVVPTPGSNFELYPGDWPVDENGVVTVHATNGRVLVAIPIVVDRERFNEELGNIPDIDVLPLGAVLEGDPPFTFIATGTTEGGDTIAEEFSAESWEAAIEIADEKGLVLAGAKVPEKKPVDVPGGKKRK